MTNDKSIISVTTEIRDLTNEFDASIMVVVDMRKELSQLSRRVQELQERLRLLEGDTNPDE